ncbi:unnamed protein product [Paramecium sonneborni]|uniref:Uncharacterized protein n=1 Tax=Paramecium sonneborni TaxID=65129 RepID=A0A8S1RRM2_9CILI|nr:unnamed protein product [Paramecium sonneborni]
MVDEIIELFNLLNQRLRNKYQFSKDRLLRLNADKLNQALDDVIKYDETKNVLLDEVKKYSDHLTIELN